MINAYRAVLLAVIGGSACSSSLPDYAAPHGGIVENSEIRSSDVITYRKLTRADFKATEPPPDVRPHAHKMGAATCVHAIRAPGNRVTMTETRSASGASRFEAHVERARFQAVMDRTCSWWNKKFTAAGPNYVLEHEQIHFALTEIEVRRLNQSLSALKHERFTGSSVEEVQHLVADKVKEKLQEMLDAALKRNREFDEDTSFGYKPKRQKEWLARVMSELSETSQN
jgi:hypothetical protein